MFDQFLNILRLFNLETAPHTSRGLVIQGHIIQRAARTGRFDAIITLGCVIRGDTPHFDYVCSETTRGIGEVGLNENLPVAFGLLTTDNLQQSLDRSGDNEENKGEEAALTILEMLAVFKQMQSAE